MSAEVLQSFLAHIMKYNKCQTAVRLQTTPDRSACQSFIGDLGLRLLGESFKTYFAFFNNKPFFGLQGTAGTHPDPFYFYTVSVIKVTGLGRLP